MARVHTVTRSNKEHTCGKGGHTIPKGDPYLWAKPGFRTRTPLIRCKAHPFKPSELVTGLASGPMAAQESFEEQLAEVDATDPDVLETLEALREELESAVREYADERQTALDAWENGNSTLEELYDTAEEAASAVESHEVEEWDGDTDLLTAEPGDEPEDDESDAYAEWDERRQEIEDAKDSWTDHVQEQIDGLSELSAGLEF